MLLKSSKKNIKQNKNKNVIVENSTIFNKRYIIGEVIGRGGLSVVHMTKDSYSEYFNDDRQFAIKIPSKELLNKKDINAFVYSEYFILSSLAHENIVKVFNFGIDKKTNTPYIVMEKLHGTLLSDMPIHKITGQMKRKFFYQLHKTLSYIHEKGIVHADINPKNIMISSSGDIKIFDFGISQNITTKKSFNLEYKNNNAYNPMYSAPTVLKGESPTKQTDFYSLACVLYELHTNETPFKKPLTKSKESLLKNKHLVKIPIMQRRWFKKVLNAEEKSISQNMPICLKIVSFIHNF